LKDLGEMVSELQHSAVTTGDIIVSGKNASVVIGSGSIEIIKGTKQTNPELADALSQVLGHLENTKNSAAAGFFETFVEEVEKREPNKTILKALWESLVSAAPTIKHLSDASAKIASLFT
jgi:heme-degrading monooxygenase HmoA